jgi:hypothetical protein
VLSTTSLCEALAGEGYEKTIVNIKVEFEEAGASSLNLRVLADFAGTAAPSYHVLRRAVQRLCVDACNEHGWVMPFMQVTLHMAPDSSPPNVEGPTQSRAAIPPRPLAPAGIRPEHSKEVGLSGSDRYRSGTP